MDDCNGVIFTPVLRGTTYLGHTCSGCGYHLKFTDHYGLYFEDTDKVLFCPHCGHGVIRFATVPIYEKQPDMSALEPFREVLQEAKDKATWLYWCSMDDNQRIAVVELLPHVNQLHSSGSNLHELIMRVQYPQPSAAARKKLSAKFGSGGKP